MMANRRRPSVRLVLTALALLALSVHVPFAALAEDAQAPSDEGAAAEVEVAQTQPDSTPPVIAQPFDVLVAAVDAAGAVVAYPVPEAIDETDGVVGVGCAPAPGSVFPLGGTLVTCGAQDAAGNQAAVTFVVTVVDQTPPVIVAAANAVVDAVDPAGAVVAYAVPTAVDAVDGAVAVGCDPAPGSFFAVGTTVVNCWAQDAAGNGTSAAIQVTVNPPPAPPATAPPATVPPTTPPATVTPTSPPATDTAQPESPASPTPPQEPAAATRPASETSTDSAGTPTTRTAEAPQESSPETTDAVDPVPVPVPAALELPWPPPDGFILIIGSGPIDGLAAIWGYRDFPVSQEYGHTAFSIAHRHWYAYGAEHGLDGAAHTGLDIGMPAGTPLYSPVDGTVKVAGGVPYFTFYGNGQPGVGELRIETDDGDQVILGHMGLITVREGQRVEAGEFVGLSGGENGDHLHLETRERQLGGWYRIVDPRRSFLIAALEAAASRADSEEATAPPDVEEATASTVPQPGEGPVAVVTLDSARTLNAPMPDLAPPSTAEPASPPELENSAAPVGPQPGDEPVSVVSLVADRAPNAPMPDLPPPDA